MDPVDDRYALADAIQCEMLAARAAETGGGGSPVWGGTVLGPGEELAVRVEVARALRQGSSGLWLTEVPPTTPW